MENPIPMDDLGIPPILGNPHAQTGQSDELAEMRQLALAPSKPGEKCAVAMAVHVDTCPSGDTLISSIALIEHIYIYNENNTFHIPLYPGYAHHTSPF